MANQYKIFGKNTLNLVLGFISWYIFRGIISGIKNQIRNEQLNGVLEQKFLSVYSPLTLTIINQLFSIIIFILNGFIIFILIK
ncbi:MAG TPA: hypothetical protein PLF21_05235, partial [Exilispira sp.]|nr:hypothetical protein [Exilispira sp.]